MEGNGSYPKNSMVDLVFPKALHTENYGFYSELPILKFAHDQGLKAIRQKYLFGQWWIRN